MVEDKIDQGVMSFLQVDNLVYRYDPDSYFEVSMMQIFDKIFQIDIPHHRQKDWALSDKVLEDLYARMPEHLEKLLRSSDTITTNERGAELIALYKTKFNIVEAP